MNRGDADANAAAAGVRDVYELRDLTSAYCHGAREACLLSPRDAGRRASPSTGRANWRSTFACVGRQAPDDLGAGDGRRRVRRRAGDAREVQGVRPGAVRTAEGRGGEPGRTTR